MTPTHTGTVTFLFTDIEGSTRILQALGDQYAGILATHREILRKAFHAFGGTEIDTAGDGFFEVFDSAKNAVNAAIAAQQGIARNPWPEGAEIRVRMGLHTGEPVSGASGYVGLDVHRAARICAAGYGDQILLSHSTRTLINEDLPAGILLLDLGEHRLKDLNSPERIFQLVFPGGRRDFPPLRSLTKRSHNLPVQLTGLVGREDDIEAVAFLFLKTSTRLVTLTGPGGTGKTRVAIQVASGISNHFQDGVFFVPLASIDDPERVVRAISQVLEVTERSPQSMADLMLDHLRDKHLLLVLDNFEQVIAAGQIVSDILKMCPRVSLLVTSRIVLHVQGEQEYPVPPLSLPDLKRLPGLDKVSQYASVVLFIQRALAVRPDFTVSNANVAAVAEICSRLDGLPLAIELAAARVKFLTPQAILSRLGNRLELLRGGARDMPARHQTLRHAIAWSYDLLTEEEKVLFRRLSIFVGGCSLDAVKPVCGGEGDVLDSLSALVDKSLLRQESDSVGESRFSMLETIREFGLSSLGESGEGESVRRAHAMYFLEFAEKVESFLTGPDQMTWLDNLEKENENLRCAIQWSLDRADVEVGLRLSGALWRFWVVRGHMIEGKQLLSTVFALPGSSSPTRARARALHGAATIMHELGAYTDARTMIDETLAIWRALGDRAGIAMELNSLCWITVITGDIQRSHPLCEESLAFNREIGDKRGVALALNNLGWLSLSQGDVASALQHHNEGLKIRREIRDKRGIAYCLANISMAFVFAGEFTSAAQYLEQARTLTSELGDDQLRAFVLFILGMMSLHKEENLRAIALLQEAVMLSRGTGNKWGSALHLAYLGRVLCSQGDYETGKNLLDEGLAIFDQEGAKWGKGLILRNCGIIALLQGKHDSATEFCVKGLLLDSSIGDRCGIAECMELMAGICTEKQEWQRAAQLFGAAEQLRERQGTPLPPCDRERNDRYRSMVRAANGEEDFGMGRKMSLEDAVQLAIGNRKMALS